MTKSFNTKIGVITNIASNMISLKSVYSEDMPEYIELDKRIRLLRYYQGSAIDQTKGDVFIPPPKFWSKKQRFVQTLDGMPELQQNEIQKENENIAFNNKIAVDKKAYFFGYIYPSLKTEYDIHVKTYRALCKQLYHTTVSKLIHKQNKTKREQKLIRNYYKYMPLVRNNCTMNLLCYHVEDIETQNKWKHKIQEEFDYTVLLSKYFTPNDKEMLFKVRKAISDAFCVYNNRIRNFKEEKDMFLYDKDYLDEVERSIFHSVEKELFDNLLCISNNTQDIANYSIYCFYNYFKNKTKSWMWELFGDNILLNLKEKASSVLVPIIDENGIEYLGKTYSLQKVSLINDSN